MCEREVCMCVCVYLEVRVCVLSMSANARFMRVFSMFMCVFIENRRVFAHLNLSRFKYKLKGWTGLINVINYR